MENNINSSMGKIKKKKGFTLIELIIVIAILGILAMIAIPKFNGIQKDAKIQADESSKAIIVSTLTTLVVKDDIVMPAAGKNKVFTFDGTSIDAGKGTDTLANKDLSNVRKAFGKIPKPQSSGSLFTATINDEGTVTVEQ